MSKQPPPAPTASAGGPCPTLIQINAPAMEVYPAPWHPQRQIYISYCELSETELNSPWEENNSKVKPTQDSDKEDSNRYPP